MKHQGSSYFCRWFTLFLVATCIVLVSPDIHSTVATRSYKQATTKETTANPISSAMRTFKTLEAMGSIEANRYNANKKNNNVNSYNSSMIASSNIDINSNKNRKRNNSNTTSIRAPIKGEWSEQLDQSAEQHGHMVSTPQTMTIILEKPTMLESTTTKATTIAASQSTTTITKATTHSDSAIKMPPDSAANINVSDIRKGTLIYQQQLQSQHVPHQHWQHWQRQRQQKQHKSHRTQVDAASSRNAKERQSYVANSLLDNSTTASMNIGAATEGGTHVMTATSQTQITIRSNSNSNSNVDNLTTAITSVTTTIPPTLTTAATTTTAITQSQQFELVRISYHSNDVEKLKLEPATETDVKMAVAREVETAMNVEAGHRHLHKFTSPYLGEADNVDEHNYAAVKQLSAQHSRWVRQAEEENEPVDKCHQFVEGEENKNEFYSPDYPNNYPKNINCTRVITAPKGQIIRLDFRNSFNIEAKEDCKFDFLEIRDGQYGFSPQIGKFCGTNFPHEITSKERYLWLHFHSDESIEYSGFTAVYEFIDRSKEAPITDLNCTIEKSGFEGYVNSTDVPTEIRDTVIKDKIPLDCIWRIQVQDNWKIQVKFLGFKLRQPNDCEANFLDIFPEQTVMPLRIKNFCGSAGEGITSESNILHIRFFAEQGAIDSNFSILYTAFRDRGAACVDHSEYDCQDATCISSTLICNGRDNCKFRWDEEQCGKETSEQSEHMIIIMVVFGLLLGGMIITFLVNCIRKILHDQKIIREHIRQSRESKLDELGRISKARSRETLTSTMPRPKHSQTSLQILDNTSNRYYREVVPMSRSDSKADLKEREHSILRHRNDMVVQTSFGSTDANDNNSETTVEAQAAANACDMGCQTRESLFATPLMHQSSMGSLKGKASPHSHSRFSTFGYDASQPAPPPPTTDGRGRQLTALNIRDAQGFIEMRERHPVPKPSMPHMHRMNALPPTPSTPATPAEMCQHHHQHAHTHVHTQQQQQKQKQLQQQSTAQQQQLSMQPSKESAAAGRSTAMSTATLAQGKVKPKLSQSTAYIDIRNSAPDVIIMTSH